MNPNIKEGVPYPDFAEYLYTLRKKAKLSREKLASQCGITGRAIVNYEHGIRLPVPDVTEKLAAALGTNAEDLLRGIDYTPDERRKAETSDVFHSMYDASTARKMQSILDATVALNAEGVLTREEADDFNLEMQKILIRMRESAREKFTPLSKRTETQKQSIAEHRRKTEEIDAQIRSKSSEQDRLRGISDFMLADDDSFDD